jgi:catechol 2,3-dioxygenase-like lactoylglutathione lyase family enzyme
MKAHVGFITLGVDDLERARRFYGEGLGWPVRVAQGHFVAFQAANGSSALTLYPRKVLADDAGVAPDGSGFRGVTFSYVVRSQERVDAVLAEAERAGGTIAKPGQQARWGGYFGYFADPDGNLWKVVAGDGDQPYAE